MVHSTKCKHTGMSLHSQIQSSFHEATCFKCYHPIQLQISVHHYKALDLCYSDYNKLIDKTIDQNEFSRLNSFLYLPPCKHTFSTKKITEEDVTETFEQLQYLYNLVRIFFTAVIKVSSWCEL